MLCFSNICFFKIFDRSNLFLDWLKLRLNFWFESAWFDCLSIAVGLIECNFRSIKSNFRPIKNRSKSFLKTLVFHVSNFSKVLSLSLHSVKVQRKIFCRFPSNFFKGFWLLRPVRPFCPSFFIYFHVSCIYFHSFWENFKPKENLVFIDFNLFFQNWSLGICYEMLLN